MGQHKYHGVEFSEDCKRDVHMKKVTDNGKARVRKLHPILADLDLEIRIKIIKLKEVVIPSLEDAGEA